MQTLNDLVVRKYLEVRDVPRRLRARARTEVTRLAGESGQTPTEYLMIVGLMAAVIVVVFATMYWDEVKTVADSWTKKVSETVRGDKIQKP